MAVGFLHNLLRVVFGGGSDIDIPTEFDELKEALRTLAEVSVDTGIADDTSTVNYLDDSSKNWPPSPGGFENLIVEITEGTGEGQFAKIASNTATRITFVVAMPVAPDSTSKYRIGFFGKMAGDITRWAGTALTGRDISLDLKALIDDSIKGILRSLSDIGVAAGEDDMGLLDRIGELKASPTANTLLARLKDLATLIGEIQASPTENTVLDRLKDLLTGIILAAGSNVIGKVQDDFGGNVYSKTMTMTDDNATRFETTAKKLRDIVIIVKTHPMLLGETGVEVYPVAADETVGFTKVDISTLYFKNAGAGNNGVITILGVEE